MESAKDTGKNVEVNEYQEALDFFLKIAIRVPLKCMDDNFIKRFDSFAKIISEVIEKEIPNKPVGEKYYELCPLCYNPSVRSDYASNYELKRCHECGQKLDWSKDE